MAVYAPANQGSMSISTFSIKIKFDLNKITFSVTLTFKGA